MESLEQIKQLTFNTLYSNNRSTSNPSYYLTNPISNIDSYAVSCFAGVNAFNLIDSRNNTINFSETDSSSTIRTAIIPTGSYTLNTMLTQLKSSLEAAGTATYTVTSSSLTNLITIASTKNFKILPAINSIYYEIGFSVSNAFAASQIATNIYDLSGVKQLVLVSSSFGTGNSILVNSNYTIMASIPIEVPVLGVINFAQNPVFINTQISELSSVSFMMLDERARVLSFNRDWSITIYVKSN